MKLLTIMTALMTASLVEAQIRATHNPGPAGHQQVISLTARRLAALSEVESGNNDHARGRAGEVSRYQITPAVWTEYSREPISQATNRWTAELVAYRILEVRISHFQRLFPKEQSEQQVYLLWSRPARVMHPTKIEAERAQRFANLVDQ